MVEKAEMWFSKFVEGCQKVVPLMPEWKPKNPNCIDLYMKCWNKHQQVLRERRTSLTVAEKEDPGPAFWGNDMVPFYDTPEEVVTHVNIGVWREMSLRIQQDAFPGWERRLELAEQVLDQLENGTSSGVSGYGLLPIQMKNNFEDLEVDGPRILDALLSAIKSKTMAGPFEESTMPGGRINSFLSVPKPNGERREVGDLSSPSATPWSKDRSFNGNVDPELKYVWPLTQLSARQFSLMIRGMGTGAVMGKTDLTQAYKNLPVAEHQRKLQRFKFGHYVFEDLRMVFGDTYAPGFFDRFHHVILVAFVTIPHRIPRCIWNKCLDDVAIVVPEERTDWLDRHISAYKEVCGSLGVKLSSSADPVKSFEKSQSGIVLGTFFDTRDMTWQLPEPKRSTLLDSLQKVVEDNKPLVLKSWESLTGKLEDLCKLWLPGRFFIDSFLNAVKKARSGPWVPCRRVKRDAKIWLAMLGAGKLPILQPIQSPPLEHIVTYSDAAGELLDTPGVGLLIPSQLGCTPRAAAWEFPMGFLNSEDENGKKCFKKTCSLEALGKCWYELKLNAYNLYCCRHAGSVVASARSVARKNRCACC